MKLHSDVTDSRVFNSFNGLMEGFKKVHKSRYKYVNSVFKGVNYKILITCRVHGDFEQSPCKHLSGRGCPECAKINRGRQRKTTRLEFILKADEVHNNRFSYTRVSYKTTHSKVVITCPIHGDFKQAPAEHLQGKGCPKCKGLLKTTEDIIKEFKEMHGDKYDYSKVVFTKMLNKVEIICPEHGPFWQTASKHSSGQGCNCCSINGFKPDSPGLLYYFKVTDGINTAWKIGITNHSLKHRYYSYERNRMSNIISVWYENGAECYAEEQRILKEYKQHKYTGPDLLKTGNTELFNTDILNLKEIT